MNKFDENSIKDYYLNLTKGEKSKLITYLSNKYHFVASTLQAKFRGYTGCNFKAFEIDAIGKELKSNKWRCLTN